jgi:hypothetical protein
MMDILAWAGILSAAAVLLREVRLMMGEIRRWVKSPPARKTRSIGIGGSLATAPLPHHRTYGSVSGGSAD